METPKAKKIQFGQTNALSVPAKRSAEDSAIKIPKKQFGSEIKLKDSENNVEKKDQDPVLDTPSKKDYRLIKKEETKEEDTSLFVGRPATLYLNENSSWTKKSKGGSLYLYDIEQRKLKKSKGGNDSAENSPTKNAKLKLDPTTDSDSTAEKKVKSEEGLQVIYRDGSSLKKIMLNTVILRESKIFQLPQQSQSVAFSAIVDGKIETYGLLFKEESIAHEFIKIVQNHNKPSV
eukprot:NODE_38_length_35257_cov_0.939047.p16 type:complete len:233 gc:universal NODE_38_length_35257_cov_0.939047:9079-9777(+)